MHPDGGEQDQVEAALLSGQLRKVGKRVIEPFDLLVGMEAPTQSAPVRSPR